MLDHVVATGVSGRQAREMLKTGKVWYRGVPTADVGRDIDPTAVEIRPRSPRIVVGRDPVVVFKDETLAVVWKPAEMLAVPAQGRRDEGSVSAIVGRILGSALVVHRLDEGTSGLMLFARETRMQEALKSLFERHEIERRYLAIVAGDTAEAYTVDTILTRDRGDGLRGSGDEGKRAITHFRRIERLQGASLVEARLETGRTHQVRIHSAEHGQAILGDPLYASPTNRGRSPRLALHAAVLGFAHPKTNVKHRFEAPLADDLEALRRSLAR